MNENERRAHRGTFASALVWFTRVRDTLCYAECTWLVHISKCRWLCISGALAAMLGVMRSGWTCQVHARLTDRNETTLGSECCTARDKRASLWIYRVCQSSRYCSWNKTKLGKRNYWFICYVQQFLGFRVCKKLICFTHLHVTKIQ